MQLKTKHVLGLKGIDVVGAPATWAKSFAQAGLGASLGIGAETGTRCGFSAAGVVAQRWVTFLPDLCFPGHNAKPDPC